MPLVVTLCESNGSRTTFDDVNLLIRLVVVILGTSAVKYTTKTPRWKLKTSLSNQFPTY